MKKVGIITFHCADNFGAVLQVFALSKKVSSFDNNVEIIDFRPNTIREIYDLKFNVKKSISENGLKSTLKRGLSNIIKYKAINERIFNFEKFRKEHLKLSSATYYYTKDLYNSKTNYDFIITGSDQVWNPNITRELGSAYLLDFAKEGVSKIAYAPSIAQNIDGNDLEYFRKSLSTFEYISVREKSAKEILTSVTDKNISVVLDPTLLLSEAEWSKVSNNTKETDKYILVYDLVKNDTIVSLANKVAREKGWKIISYSSKKGYENWKSSFFSVNPVDFLTLFKNAEFVITSSFHGTAFSVIFNKPFYTVPHPTRGSRMIDFVTELGIADRIIKSSKDKIYVDECIDYEKVNAKLKILRDNSLEYLKRSLNYGIENEN